jgi:hypothetical protein
MAEGKREQRVQGEVYTAPEERKPTIHVSMHMNRAKSLFLLWLRLESDAEWAAPSAGFFIRFRP